MRRENKKNIIYLVADSLRPDYLGCYGGSATLTTEIDDLASKGVQFENVISAAPWTIPSVKSHATGKYPHNIGIFDPNADEEPTVFDRFKGHGYTTALYYDSDRRTELFPNSIDHYDWSYDLEGLLDFISDNKDEPFFIFNLYRGTHLPYTLKYSSEAWHRAKDQLMELIQHGGKEGIEEAKYRYARSVERFSEWYVGAIVDRLEKEGILKDTAIVITSDHGESWGTRFESQEDVDIFDLHGTLLYNEVLKIPLILYNFGISREETVEEMVRSIDILPTISELLDVPVDNNFDGVSLVPSLKGQKDNWPELAFSCTTSYEVFSDIGKNSDQQTSTYTGFSVLRSDGWKYIMSVETGNKELFNTATDPEEMENRIEERGKIADQLESQLQETFESVLSDKADHSEEVRSRLEDLGYL